MSTRPPTIVSVTAGQSEALGRLISSECAPVPLRLGLGARVSAEGATDGVQIAAENGDVDAAGDLAGVAVWLRHDLSAEVWVSTYQDCLMALWGIGSTWRDSLRSMLVDHHPRAPHSCLALLAVRDERQGHGIATALLRHHHRQLDKGGVSAFVYATDRRSRRLFLRNGYQAAGAPVSLGVDAAPVFPMWRAPGIEPAAVTAAPTR